MLGYAAISETPISAIPQASPDTPTVPQRINRIFTATGSYAAAQVQG